MTCLGMIVPQLDYSLPQLSGSRRDSELLNLDMKHGHWHVGNSLELVLKSLTSEQMTACKH